MDFEFLPINEVLSTANFPLSLEIKSLLELVLDTALPWVFWVGKLIEGVIIGPLGIG